MLNAVVFDLDGVLIDSEPLWEQVRRELVEERGGRWLAEAQSRLMGMSTPEWAQYLHEDLAVDLPPNQIAETVISRMAARYEQELPLLPDAADALHRVGQRWRLGLASSSPRVLIDTVLAAAGWTHLFDVTVSTEQVAAGKPAPDVYRAAVGQLQTAPGSTAAVEDSTNGMRSAAAAGLHLIAIPRLGYAPAEDALKRADLVLPGLAALSVAALESLA